MGATVEVEINLRIINVIKQTTCTQYYMQLIKTGYSGGETALKIHRKYIKLNIKRIYYQYTHVSPYTASYV